jgi:hypothetical protein
VMVSLGVVAMPLFARGDRWIYFWACLEGLLVVGLWFFALANRPRSPHIPPANSSRLVAQAILSGAIAALAMMILATLVMPRLDSANKHRSRAVAAAIRAALPVGAQLWVLEDSYRPFWYYLEPDVRYFHRLSELPAEANYLLLPATQTPALLQNPIWLNAPPTLLLQAVDNENRVFDLFSRNNHP